MTPPEQKHVQNRHRSYLMRIWSSGENTDADWRVSLVDPASGEQIGFTDVDALSQYIQMLIHEDQPPPEAHFRIDT